MSRESRPFHDILRELPEALQEAVHRCVAACKPQFRPRLYISDWTEELYHEAVCVAYEALTKFDPSRGNLYEFGLMVIGQRLQRFCDKVWRMSRCECEWPVDEEEYEEIEVEDQRAALELEAHLMKSWLMEALSQLASIDAQVGEMHLVEGLTEREIAKRLGCSQKAVNKRLHKIKMYLRHLLDSQ